MMKKVNKKLASAVVLGLMLAVPVGVSAQTVNDGDILYGMQGTNITIEGVDTSESVVFEGNPNEQFSLAAVGGEAAINNIDNITLQGTWGGDGSVFYTNGADSKISIDVKGIITSNGELTGSMPFHAMGGEIYVKANEINLVGTGNAVFAQKNGAGVESIIKIEAAGDVFLSSNTGVTVAAASLNANDAGKESVVEITSGKNITIVSQGSAVSAYGSDWKTGDAVSNSNKVKLNAAGDIIIEGTTAIYAKNGIGDGQEAKVEIEGTNVKVNGKINADNYGDIKIGANQGFVQADITGDVTANNNSDVAINLGSGSLNGAIINDDTSAVSLNMADGIWNVDGDSRLRMLNGEGVIALNVDDIDDVDTVEIDDAKNADITLAAQQDADHVDDANAALAAMASAVTGLEDGTVVKIDEGILNGATQGTLEGDTVTQVTTQDTTTTMGNMRDLASVALVAWRQEDSTLSQRLGELRNSEGDQGIWARMSRGEFEYDGAFKNQYNYFQMGYDWAAGDWHYGAAISHNDGQTTYAQGSGENDSTSLTLYGTWVGDKGQYTDIVVKQGKINNEYTNYAAAGVTKADYDMWGTAISAEYGQKLEMQNDWYVTPQAQLTYMRIGGEDYTASVDGKPMQVSQDGMDSFVGRIGFEAGKNISDKGSVYVKASLLHEFAGEADTYLQLGGIDNSYTQDLGDTWYECGFGVNYKTSDNSYLYADVVKTYGGDVETPWQWNAGMRWSF